MVNDTITTVRVDSGELDGVVDPATGARSFLGVPYAAPPVGPLRWKPPQHLEPWEGVRAAKSFGPSAIQAPPAEGSLYFGGEREFSEDCLNLNVWTGAEGDSGRPVVVWLHFGAYQFGSASNPFYDGTALAAAGLTVVSVNHRLGRLGFLAHPDLSAESGYGGSGNYGLMDQVAALEWVQRNIEAFGGDPRNVTLFGVSAGGNSVHNLRSSPLAEGLFAKAIAQSAPGVAPALDGFGHPANASTLAAGEQAGEELFDLLGISTLAELRSLPVDRLMEVQLPRTGGPWAFDLIPGAAISLHVFDSGYPVIDGHVLPKTPLEAYADGTAIDVPFIAGNAGNEASGLPYLPTLAAYETYVEDEFGVDAAEVLRLYPASDDASAQAASWQLVADQIFVWSNWTAARLQSARLSSPVWHYRFLQEPAVPASAGVIEGDYAGAFHGSDVPYIFGTLDSRAWDWTDDDRRLSDAIQRSWVSFARTGDPTDGGALEWPEFDPARPSSRIWQAESRIDDVSDGERMAFWDRRNGIASQLG
ncbi:carboxylesterase family protein [Herbiconiux sp. CPCC 203407]|uniref:Carboxylic ester hydrolase n=1 Tax=Herbiconiux oxytropis TaxID=2970915 RepID=A0AA42BUT3_9MICO|nr:carboxylesterase family protein [Herbiconiux oxytropis]MCS5722576.1 carboxylesterase family protein [Herbiconiux oxytropis]MCS5726516.1 carboxylesterase family protein [Herbiconiux oxytropis]